MLQSSPNFPPLIALIFFHPCLCSAYCVFLRDAAYHGGIIWQRSGRVYQMIDTPVCTRAHKHSHFLISILAKTGFLTGQTTGGSVTLLWKRRTVWNNGLCSIQAL